MSNNSLPPAWDPANVVPFSHSHAAKGVQTSSPAVAQVLSDGSYPKTAPEIDTDHLVRCLLDARLRFNRYVRSCLKGRLEHEGPPVLPEYRINISGTGDTDSLQEILQIHWNSWLLEFTKFQSGYEDYNARQFIPPPGMIRSTPILIHSALGLIHRAPVMAQPPIALQGSAQPYQPHSSSLQLSRTISQSNTESAAHSIGPTFVQPLATTITTPGAFPSSPPLEIRTPYVPTSHHPNSPHAMRRGRGGPVQARDGRWFNSQTEKNLWDRNRHLERKAKVAMSMNARGDYHNSSTRNSPSGTPPPSAGFSGYGRPTSA